MQATEISIIRTGLILSQDVSVRQNMVGHLWKHLREHSLMLQKEPKCIKI